MSSAAPILGVYNLTSRDAAGGRWGPYFDAVQFTANSVAIDTFENTADLPIDHLIFYTHINVRANPGGAQTVTDLGFYIADPNGAVISMIALDFPVAPAAGQEIDLDREVDFAAVPGRHRLTGFGGFSAAVAANNVAMHVAGYIVPRGNVAVF